jgi:hypothetical protein
MAVRVIVILALLCASPVFAGLPDESSGISSAAEQTNNVPNPLVIALLTQRFERARAPLASGDLYLGRRWMCREFFTEPGGYSSYRFRNLRLTEWEKGILEDELGASPRYYVYTAAGLFGTASQRGGPATEIRVDRAGNLRLVSRDAAGKATSYTVCLAKNRVAD